MHPDAFEHALRHAGFAEVETKTLPPGLANTAHAHAFEVRALVLDGDITLTADGERRTYGPGDVFSMAAGREHAEQVGEAGVRYLVGRKR